MQNEGKRNRGRESFASIAGKRRDVKKKKSTAGDLVKRCQNQNTGGRTAEGKAVVLKGEKG